MGRKRKTGERVLGPYYDAKSGLWRVCLRAAGRPDEWAYAASEKKATQVKAAMEAVLKAPLATTISDATDEYQSHLRATGRQESTIDEAGARLRPLARILGEDRVVDSLKRHHIKARLAQVNAIATRKGTLGRVRHFCQWAIERGYLDKDPTEGLRVDGVVQRGKPRLTRTEARLLDSHLWDVVQKGPKPDREKALASLTLLYLGMREGELLRLQVRDIDFGSSPAVVQIERQAKTTKGYRDFEMPDHLAVALKKHVEGQQLTGWVWPSKRSRSGHMEKSWILKAVTKTCQSLGVTVTGPQGLRGTHARMSSDAGATAHLVAQQLGHESTDVTVRSYIGEEAVERKHGRQVLKVLKGGGGE